MDLLQQHQVLATLLGFWVFSAVISGMPAPLPNSSRGYTWLYGSLHILAANITNAMQKKYGDAAVPLSPGDSAQLKNVQMTPEGLTADSATIKKAE